MKLSVQGARVCRVIFAYAVGGLLGGLLFYYFVYFSRVQTVLGLWFILAGLISLAIAQEKSLMPKTPLGALAWVVLFGFSGTTLCLTGLLMIYGP